MVCEGSALEKPPIQDFPGWIEKTADTRLHSNGFSWSNRSRLRGDSDHSPRSIKGDSKEENQNAGTVEDTPPHRNRFSAFCLVPEAEPAQSIEGHDAKDRPRTRLVLVSQHSNDKRGHDREWDSDTDTVGGASDVEVTEIVAPAVEEAPVPMDVRVRAPVRAFTGLDAIYLTDLFEHRDKMMQSVLHVIRGAFRTALGLSGDGGQQRSSDYAWLETLSGVASDDVVPS